MTAALFAAAPTPAAAASGTRAQTPGRIWRAALASCTALFALASLTSACTPHASSGAPAEAPEQSYVQPAPESTRPQAVSASKTSQAGMASIRVAELPRQGQIVYRMILAGGPFPFDKDGDVFGNRERLLPKYPRGYYREYTVAPAHVRNRGAKRIVCGGAPRTPDVCYYTQDHYNSFRQIVN